jgi:hypothetical protein
MQLQSELSARILRFNWFSPTCWTCFNIPRFPSGLVNKKFISELDELQRNIQLNSASVVEYCEQTISRP